MSRARSTSSATNSSAIDSSTTSRAPAEQTWPECRKTAVIAMSRAVARSASAKTMLGFLPPSSRATFFTVPEAAAMMRLPVPRPPVNETRSTRGSSLSGAPALGPSPRTRLPTPAGSPASSSSRIRWIAVCGESSLGLSTNVQPAASAGATFQETWSSG